MADKKTPKIPAINVRLDAKFSAEQIRHFLKCYLDRHAWDEDSERFFMVRNRHTRRMQIRHEEICMRCNTQRVENMGIANGKRLGSFQYHYSEGYRMAKGERITPGDRDAIRLFRASKAKITIIEES